MELVGKLKDDVAQAKDKEEAKKIMENAGMKLTDDELDTVAGGLSFCVHPYHGNKAGHLSMEQITISSTKWKLRQQFVAT